MSDFDKWFADKYGEAFKSQPGAMGLAFKEVAELAWQASRRAALEEGYALGFNASGEGWNGEYPARDMTCDPKWIKDRDEEIARALSHAKEE